MKRCVSDFRPADYNPRKIKDHELQRLGKSMKRFGDLSGVVVNKTTGNLIGGHQRVKHFDPSWPIKIERINGSEAWGYIETSFGPWTYREVEWTPAMEKSANIAANAHGGEFDNHAVTDILKELQADGEDLDFTGFDIGGLEDISLSGDEDEIPDTPATPKTKLGDLYLLGDHRLLCGDSTSKESVARVMGGVRAQCMWTDPPYGVSYVGKTKAALTIKNDGADGLEPLLRGAFTAASAEALAPGASLYIAHPAGAPSVTFGVCFLAQGWRLHETLVWVKDVMVMGHSDYHYRHEPILFGYATGGTGRQGRGGSGWYGPNNATSVFEVPRPKASPDHPTGKPVELITSMLTNSTKAGDLVFEPFLGSGSTLIACEVLKRRCYGLELDPRYCDVIVERWEKLTGEKASRIAQNSGVGTGCPGV